MSKISRPITTDSIQDGDLMPDNSQMAYILNEKDREEGIAIVLIPTDKIMHCIGNPRFNTAMDLIKLEIGKIMEWTSFSDEKMNTPEFTKELESDFVGILNGEKSKLGWFYVGTDCEGMFTTDTPDDPTAAQIVEIMQPEALEEMRNPKKSCDVVEIEKIND